jgi:hypothetical protein
MLAPLSYGVVPLGRRTASADFCGTLRRFPLALRLGLRQRNRVFLCAPAPVVRFLSWWPYGIPALDLAVGGIAWFVVAGGTIAARHDSPNCPAMVRRCCGLICARFSGAGAYGGTARTAKRYDDTSTGAILHGGNVSADTKHLLSTAQPMNKSCIYE